MAETTEKYDPIDDLARAGQAYDVAKSEQARAKDALTTAQRQLDQKKGDMSVADKKVADAAATIRRLAKAL